jgi:hypothetical protein
MCVSGYPGGTRERGWQGRHITEQGVWASPTPGSACGAILGVDAQPCTTLTIKDDGAGLS